MKPSPYLLRLFKPDQENRKLLQKHYSKIEGRNVEFASIVRLLMKEKVSTLALDK